MNNHQYLNADETKLSDYSVTDNVRFSRLKGITSSAHIYDIIKEQLQQWSH